MAKRPAKTPPPPPSSGARVEMMDLDDLAKRATLGNPKEHDPASLKESFRAVGFVDPVVLDERTGKNVSGHGRVDALLEMRAAGEPPPDRIVALGGRWYVPTLRGIAFKDAAAAARYLLATNRIGELGGWDNKALADMLGGFGEDLLGTGFTGDDVVRFLSLAAGPTSPGAFPEVGGDLATAFCCPKCHYEWSGNPLAGKVETEPAAPERASKKVKRAAAR